MMSLGKILSRTSRGLLDFILGSNYDYRHLGEIRPSGKTHSFRLAYGREEALVHLQKRFTICLVALVMLVSTVAPAFAAPEALATGQVQFQNKTGAEVRITLTGATTLAYNLGTGKTKVDVPVGTYKYSYVACDKTNTGTLKVKTSGASLTLPKCANAGSGGGDKTVKLVIQNQTDGTLYFTFTGPATYYVTAPPGKKTKVDMLPGKYTYVVSGTACGSYSSETDSLNLKNGLNWRWFCL